MPSTTLRTDSQNAVAVGGGTEPLIIRRTSSTQSRADYDKTWQEVHDALASGRMVIEVGGYSNNSYQNVIVSTTATTHESGYFMSGKVYGVSVAPYNGTVVVTTYKADSADGYLYQTA